MVKTKIIVFFLCITMITVSFVGCSSKMPITSNQFSQTMIAANFTVENVTARTQTNGLATSVIVAVKDDGSYQIEFWELTDGEVGKNVYNNNKKQLSKEHSSKAVLSEFNLGNYNYYAFTADGNFHMVTRIDNTMLYCEVDKEYKEEIIDFAEQLGYK